MGGISQDAVGFNGARGFSANRRIIFELIEGLLLQCYSSMLLLLCYFFYSDTEVVDIYQPPGLCIMLYLLCSIGNPISVIRF